MSEQDSNETPTSDSGVVVSRGKRPLPFKLKPPVFLAVVVVAAAIIGAGGYLLLSGSSSAPEKTNSTNGNSSSALTEQSEKLATKGDYKGAEAVVDKQIASATDKTDKAQLIFQQATIAFNAGKYQDALTYAKQGDAIETSPGTDEFIAQIYVKLNDTDQAKTYLNRAISTLKSDAPAHDSTLAQYQSELQALE